MGTLGCVVLGAVALGFLIAVVWRVGSRRHELPCPARLRWLVELDNPFTRTNRAACILETLRLEPGMHVLDAGCGPGRLTVPAAKAVGEQGCVVAMDIQAGMLARVREKARREGLANIEFLSAGLGQGRLPASRFDRALLVTVLGEIPDRAAALAELSDALKPGGILAVTEVVFDPHFQPRSTVSRLAEEAGFGIGGISGNRMAFTMLLEKPLAG